MEKINLFSTFLCLVLCQTTAFSCRCLMEYEQFNIVEYSNFYDVIFTGQVVKLTATPLKHGGNQMTATFKIDEVYKGESQKYVEISYQDNEGTSCEFGVGLGYKYLIYANYDERRNLNFQYCSRRSSVMYDEEVKTFFENQIDSLDKLGGEENVKLMEELIRSYKFDMKAYYNYISDETVKELNYLDSLRQLKNGKHNFYYEEKIVADGKMKNGKQTGKWTFYNEEGKIIFQGKYKKGQKTGRWREYREIIGYSMGKYKKGRKHGKWIDTWTGKKVVEKGGIYEKGRLIERLKGELMD